MTSMRFFEIPAEDLERSREFYTILFGWKAETGGAFGNMVMRTQNEDGSEGPSGLISKREHPEQEMTNYFEVSSVEKRLPLVEKMGGRVLVRATPVPGKGVFALCLDPDGNVFGLWQTDSGAG